VGVSGDCPKLVRDLRTTSTSLLGYAYLGIMLCALVSFLSTCFGDVAS